MSYRRFARGVRQMGGFAGGSSRLARPPAPLQEPDVKPGGRCPTLVASHAHGPPAGLSDDGSLLYSAAVGTLTVLNFPALTTNSTVDLDPAMDALGAGGGGSIRAATIDDTGHLYALGYITTSTDLQIMKVLLDGTGESLLATLSGTSGSNPAISWHPADPDFVYVLNLDDSMSTGSELRKVHRSTGTVAMVEPLDSSTFFGNSQMQQYDGGFVFFLGTDGSPTTGDIWVYDIAADAFDSIDVTDFGDSFGGMGTRPDGYTVWGGDFAGSGGDQGVHAFNIDNGPTMVDTSDVCDDAWGIGGFYDPPIYWFANPNRTLVYVSSGVNVWQWT